MQNMQGLSLNMIESTMKKPQSRQASPSCWIALERSMGLEEVS